MTSINYTDPESYRTEMNFDPKCPITLIISPVPTYPGETTVKKPPLRTILSDNGTGCNPEETSALIQILDRRDEYYENSSILSPISVQNLSRSYRMILVDCLSKWEARLYTDEIVEHSKEERTNLELLKVTHTIMHLCEIFLLCTSDDLGPGAITKKFVKYLRLNHMDDSMESIKEFIHKGDIQKILSLPQPEHFERNGKYPYWIYLRSLIQRGRLEDAWEVLSCHSACRRCSLFYSYDLPQQLDVDPTVKEDAGAFGLIKALLLCAPLPGGRTDCNDYDDGKEDVESDEDYIPGIPSNAFTLWNTESCDKYDLYAAKSIHHSWKNTLKKSLSKNVPLMNLTRRIPFLQTNIWDIMFGNVSDDDTWVESLLAELLYVRPHLRKDDIHIRTLSHMQKCYKDNPSAVGHLEETLLSVMKGNAGSVVQALHVFGGGSGAALPATMTTLLCHLLIETNRIIPSQLSYDIKSELILSAASSIQASFASQNHHDVGIHLSVRLLLPHAIPIISTNIHDKINQDSISRIAAYTGTILMHHSPNSDAEADNLMKLCMSVIEISCIGSRYVLDACESLALSRGSYYLGAGKPGDAVFWFLRGMECACRWNRYLSINKDNHQTVFVKGKTTYSQQHLSPQKEVLDNNSDARILSQEPKNTEQPIFVLNNACIGSPCMRHFIKLCDDVAINILEIISEYWFMSKKIRNDDKNKETPLLDELSYNVQKVGEIMSTVKDNEPIGALLEDEPYLLLLRDLMNIAMHSIKVNQQQIAKSIVHALEEHTLKDGSVGTYAYFSFYGAFLYLALCLLKADDNVTQSLFGVHGIFILMSRFTEYENMEKKNSFPKLGNKYPNKISMLSSHHTLFDFSVMRFELCNGLMRAFISENKKLKNTEWFPESVKQISSVEEMGNVKIMDNCTKSMEFEVNLMLGPSF